MEGRPCLTASDDLPYARSMLRRYEADVRQQGAALVIPHVLLKATNFENSYTVLNKRKVSVYGFAVVECSARELRERRKRPPLAVCYPTGWTHRHIGD
ncbi:hypothetical protein ACRALDRAFT_1074373 [Sodiomyces alcalophilus JCM 7366]|uniref:uncharacterized protein n=1 Tax=Sodiomyces alcalophilus JCM 7366 TaxID=591952 RepID=UPI0039B55C30